MKSKKIIVIPAVIVILFVVGVFSMDIKLGDFFFTTKYYDTPLAAYNAGSTYHAVLGNTEASSQLGLVELDENTALFLGKIDQNNFVISEMEVHKGEYAVSGLNFYYDILSPESEEGGYSTETSSGPVEWWVCFSQEAVDKLSDVSVVKEFSFDKEQKMYVVVRI